jgi:hypothetical protein
MKFHWEKDIDEKGNKKEEKSVTNDDITRLSEMAKKMQKNMFNNNEE